MRTALVIGGADCVWTDIEAALDLGEYHGAVACNDAGATWPGHLDAIATLHGEKAHMWIERRVRRGLAACPVYGHAGHGGRRTGRGVTATTEYRFPGQTETGSSGLFALKVALIDLGFDRAVLCGVPMTAEAKHFFDAAPWTASRSHRRGWVQSLPVIKDRARSMSGWTAEQLGEPDEAWVAGKAA